MQDAGVPGFCCLVMFAIAISLFPRAQAFPEVNGAVVCDGEEVRYLNDGKIVEARGGVSITYQDMRLTCDKITIYTETRDGYAEGNVVLSEPEGTVRGEKIIYNFDTRKGILLTGRFRSGPYYGGADKVQKTGEKKLLLKKGHITTCDLEEPHYKITARKIKIFLGNKVIARDAVFWVGRIPLFYLPYYCHSLKEGYPGVSLIPGHNERWGYHLLTAWRYYSSPASSGYLHLDYRELKGAAYGVDYFFRTHERGRGALKSYYVAERDKEFGSDGGTERSRYLAQFRHYWQVDENTAGYFEYYRAKDASVSKDYFYHDYEKEPQPPSRFSLVHNQDDPARSLFFSLRKRTNKFYHEVEQLPLTEIDFVKRRIGGSNFYYQAEIGAANLSKKTAHISEDTDTARFDTYNELAYSTRPPGALRWLEFTPYLGTRQTFYTRDLSGENRDFFRGVFQGGGGLSTRCYRIYERRGKFLGIELNRLKHIVTPKFEYDYVREPTVAAGQLESFDSVDTQTRKNALRISLENKLQTRWLQHPGEAYAETVDLASLFTWIDYFPRQVTGEKDFSDLGILLELQPYRWLNIDADAYYDPYNEEFETINVDLFAQPGGKWSLGLGNRYQKESRSELTTDFSYRFSPKWKFRFYQRYEFENNESEEQEYTLYRDLHCWVAELTVNRRGPAHGDAIFLALRLKAFPEIPFSFRTAYPGRRGRQIQSGPGE